MPFDFEKNLPRTATGTEVEAADIALSEHLARHRRHPALRALAAASQVGDQAPLLAIGTSLLGGGWLLRDRRAAWAGGRMLLAVLGATAVKGAIKNLVSRTRPNILLEQGHYEVRAFGPNEGSWHSFPSGHTAGSVAAARALAREYPGSSSVFYTGAVSIGLAQLPTGAHFASDVLAGSLIGFVSEAAANRAWMALSGSGATGCRKRTGVCLVAPTERRIAGSQPVSVHRMRSFFRN